MEMEIFSTLVCARVLHQEISLEALERIEKKKKVIYISGNFITEGMDRLQVL